MFWNIAPECVSTVVLSIIWIYSRKGTVTLSLKNKLFQFCFLITFLAMTANIIATLLIYNLSPFTILPAWIVNIVYFITTPLMGCVYCFYVLATIYEHRTISKPLIIALLLPAILYVAMVFINPFTHWIFTLSLTQGYEQGPFISTTYIIFYVYCIFSILMVLIKGKYVEQSIRIILFSFPVIAAIVIIVQLMFPEIMLSGSAATIALLMVYLYLQNKQISIDYLTNLANRQEFLNLLDWHMNVKTKSFHVIIVSLREFKRINDVYGQVAGDAFLVAVSSYLRQEFHLSNDQLFRYSGDEFAILVRDMSNQDSMNYVEIIRKRMLKPWQIHGYSCLLYVALGIVAYPTCARSKEEVINGIEFSINLAKRDASNNHTCYCVPSIINKVQRRQQVLEVLHQCLQEHTFEIYYQPIYDVKLKKFQRAEALLRIPNSIIGPIYPDECIPIAEESGLLIEITYHVLDEVCHIIQELKQKSIMFQSISVNFSTSQFSQPDIMENVIGIIQKHDVDGALIKIEITEGTLTENADAMLDYVRQMNAYGIEFSLDDFGTGYSNTSSVLTFPIETIKLDKSLIWAAMKDERSALVVKNLANTFHDLGFIVLAEGVETQEQSAFVEDCNCSLIQGYLYAKPMPKEDFIKFIREQK